MARMTGPVCRLCRRENHKLFLKGSRCYTQKCPMERRPTIPGQHGEKNARRKTSQFGMQLREKQKTKRYYGVLEAQFRRYYERASRVKGVTGQYMLQLLERRLDNVVYRAGFASSRPEARQMVRHGHFTVNGRRVNVPSYEVREQDVIAVAEASKSLPRFKELAAAIGARTIPAWIEVDPENLRARIVRLPQRDEIDVPVQEHLIIELYSR